ncbi:hypothetical protein ACFY5D_14100 [Paeniglutamicibacter sp. NPDC012692]|uniref:hypothetical protein n=1 Tax=Paeniglutamicibacter sp. NPDC012692 TaxID=3364388 RepID=UPI00369ECC74
MRDVTSGRVDIPDLASFGVAARGGHFGASVAEVFPATGFSAAVASSEIASSEVTLFVAGFSMPPDNYFARSRFRSVRATLENDRNHGAAAHHSGGKNQ